MQMCSENAKMWFRSIGMHLLDIRTKLALTLVFVSLLSMLLLGAFTYQTSSGLLKDISLRQLDALAESKARDLTKVQQGWKDQLTLIRNGSELQAILNAYEAGDTESLRQLVHLINHAAAEVRNVDQIKLTDQLGHSLVWGEAPHYAEVPLPSLKGGIGYGRSYVDTEGKVRVVLNTLLSREDHEHVVASQIVSPNPEDLRIVGNMEIVFDADDLNTVTSNYTGLGETGEVMLVALRNDDTVMVLNSLRHRDSLESREFPLAVASVAVRNVLSGKSGIFADGFKDYRGEQVWAATRFLPAFNWGLVVKVDVSEESQASDTLLADMFDIGVSLSAFAILCGTLLGFYLARPIHEFEVLVRRVLAGETTLRADAEGDDEIAYLAESLNDLLDNLAEANSLDVLVSPGSSSQDSLSQDVHPQDRSRQDQQ